MTTSMNEADGQKWKLEEWARRIQELGTGERERRLQAVNLLLEQPEDLSQPLESELYIHREALSTPPAVQGG